MYEHSQRDITKETQLPEEINYKTLVQILGCAAEETKNVLSGTLALWQQI